MMLSPIPTHAADFSDYAGPELQAVISAAASVKRFSMAEIALSCRGRMTHAAHRQAKDDSDPIAVTRVRGGCIAKSLTAMLVAQAVAEGKLKFEQSVASVFAVNHLDSSWTKTLTSVRILDLLNHTHGLDDSAVHGRPRDKSGRIKTADLLAGVLSVPCLAAPGALYSYGSGGSWIAAAALEAIYDRSYKTLLREKIFDPLAIAMENGDPASEYWTQDICPASGNDLRLSAIELLKIATRHFPVADDLQSQAPASDLHADSLQRLCTELYSVPGWQARFSRVGLGWNEYGAGWFGHSAKFAGESALIRFSPERSIAIAVTGVSEEAAYAVLAAVFGHLLPEFALNTTPKYLATDAWQRTDPSRYLGVYENAAWSIAVDVAKNKLLRVRAYLKEGLDAEHPEPFVKRYLKPAEHEVFFSDPPEPVLLPYMQFLAPNSDGAYSYLQNGRQAFIRRA